MPRGVVPFHDDKNKIHDVATGPAGVGGAEFRRCLVEGMRAQAVTVRQRGRSGAKNPHGLTREPYAKIGYIRRTNVGYRQTNKVDE